MDKPRKEAKRMKYDSSDLCILIGKIRAHIIMEEEGCESQKEAYEQIKKIINKFNEEANL